MRANQVARIVEQEPEKLKLPLRDSDFLPDVAWHLKHCGQQKSLQKSNLLTRDSWLITNL